MPTHHAVTSSVLKSFVYSPFDETLKVLFHDGSHRTYHDIPPLVAFQLKSHKSPGKFFNEHIRNHRRST